MTAIAGTPTLELRGISKSFGSSRALDNIDLVIPAAATTVLIGPSGCGKSTLLRLLIGLTRADFGTISFEGSPIIEHELGQLRLRMGYVIQDGGLFPHLSAYDNVALMARHIGWSQDKVSHRIEELANLMRLPAGSLDRYPLQLSGGQRQRVSLMRALMLDPAVLLLDEPLGALDPLIRAELQDDLKQIFQTLRKTVVLVTHDLAEAAFFADQIVLMRDGHIVQKGSLTELSRSPSEPFVTTFVNAQRHRIAALEELA